MIEKIKIICINIILILFVWFICDIAFFITDLIRNNICSKYTLKTFYMRPNNPISAMNDFLNDNTGNRDNKECIRKPIGTQYKKEPIILFGCSFAYGEYLNEEQTFGYKLSKITKRPVYNRAFDSYGLQHMFYQSSLPEFYYNVPKSNTVIYIFMYDHYRRMLSKTFALSNPNLYLHYKYKNNNLLIDNYDDILINCINYSYTIRAIKGFFKSIYMQNPNNADKITEEALTYFIKTRENLENHWNIKVNFIVFFYDENPLDKILIQKLKKNNFMVITTKELTTQDLYEQKYRIKDDPHPNETSWNLLTPLFVQKVQMKKII